MSFVLGAGIGINAGLSLVALCVTAAAFPPEQFKTSMPSSQNT
jgi:hypothetical protein